jgi:hypothetical protein
MKILVTTLLLLASGLAFADVAVYNGAKVTKTTSLAGTSTVADKFIEVVDLNSGEIVIITLSGKGKKTFTTEAVTTVVKTEVQDSRGAKKASTVLAQAGTTTDATTGVVTVSSFLQIGGNLQVSIKTGEKVGLPRNMHGTASLVSTAGLAAAVTEYVDVKSTLVLQEAASRLSNDAGETLAAAVDRIEAGLIAKGYVDADADADV